MLRRVIDCECCAVREESNHKMKSIDSRDEKYESRAEMRREAFALLKESV